MARNGAQKTLQNANYGQTLVLLQVVVLTQEPLLPPHGRLPKYQLLPNLRHIFQTCSQWGEFSVSPNFQIGTGQGLARWLGRSTCCKSTKKR